MDPTDPIPDSRRFSFRLPRPLWIGLVAMVPTGAVLTWFQWQTRHESKGVNRTEVVAASPELQYSGTMFRREDDDSSADGGDFCTLSPTSPDDRPAGLRPDAKDAIEAQIVDGIFARIRKTARGGKEFDVQVTLRDGIAVLRGTVSSDALRQQLVEAARESAAGMEDVREVRDLLVTKQVGVGEKALH